MFETRHNTFTVLLLMTALGCGSSDSDETPPGTAPQPGAAASTTTDPAAVGAGAEATDTAEADPEAPEAQPPAEAPTTDVFALPAPTRGGEHPVFEAVPQSVARYADPGTFEPSPNGHLVAVPSDSGVLTIVDASTGRIRASRRVLRRAREVGMTIAWDSSSQHIAIAGDDGGCIWDLVHDRLRCGAQIAAVGALGRGGRRAVGWGYDGDLKAWTRGSRHVRAIEGVEGGVRRVSVHRNHTAAELRRDGGVVLLGPNAQRVVLEGVGLVNYAFAPSGRHLLTTSEGKLQMRDATDGHLIGEAPLPDVDESETVVLWSARGERAAICTRGQLVQFAALGDTLTLTAGTDRCGRHSRPVLHRDRAGTRTNVFGSAIGRDEEHAREVGEDGSGERSLWTLEVGTDYAQTNRRGGAEYWSATGVGRRRSNVDTGYEEEEFDGLLATSPSRQQWVRVGRGNRPRLHRRGADSVGLQDATPLACDEWMGCAARAYWSADDSRLALVHPDKVEVFNTATGARIGRAQTARACDPACGQGEVCIDGECTTESYTSASVAFSPDGTRFVASAEDGSVRMYSAEGERLARLAAPGQGQRHELSAFSPDGATVAFVRRRRLQFFNTADANEHRSVTLPHWARALSFADDGSSVRLVSSDGHLLTYAVATGEQTGDTDLGDVRAIDPGNRFGVACRDGFVHYVSLADMRTRGPLGRCPSGGRFVIAPDTGFIGYTRGTLARLHRLSDGEVLNMRSVWRDRGRRVRVAFTDSGWAQVLGGGRGEAFIRTGSILSGEMQNRVASNRARETLLAEFFGGRPIPPVGAAAASASSDMAAEASTMGMGAE